MSNDINIIDGVEFLPLSTLALLCGISAAEADAEYRQQQVHKPGRFSIPQSWTRGCKEMQAKHGTRNFEELLTRIRADQAVGGAA